MSAKKRVSPHEVMCMWNKSKSVLFSQVVVQIFSVLWVVCLVGIPFILRWYFQLSGRPEMDGTPLNMVLYISMLPAGIALICLRRLLKNIRHDITFVPINVQYLRILSWCCFFVGVVFFFFAFYYILALIVGAAAAFMGLILRVIKNVFAQATAIKEENDYTI